MKMVAEYLEHALQFERLAAREENPELKAEMKGQALDYRRLAAERAGCTVSEPPKYSGEA